MLKNRRAAFYTETQSVKCKPITRTAVIFHPPLRYSLFVRFYFILIPRSACPMPRFRLLVDGYRITTETSSSSFSHTRYLRTEKRTRDEDEPRMAFYVFTRVRIYIVYPEIRSTFRHFPYIHTYVLRTRTHGTPHTHLLPRYTYVVFPIGKPVTAKIFQNHCSRSNCFFSHMLATFVNYTTIYQPP